MNTLEAVDHLSNFYLQYLTALFTGGDYPIPYDAQDDMSVGSWNPFTFVLVYAEKNVFLGIIFWLN